MELCDLSEPKCSKPSARASVPVSPCGFLTSFAAQILRNEEKGGKREGEMERGYNGERTQGKGGTGTERGREHE